MQQQAQYFDPYTQFNPLPQFMPELTIPGWSMAAEQQPRFGTAGPMQSQFNNFGNHPVFDPNNAAYPFPVTYDPNTAGMPGNDQYMQQQSYWDMDAGAFGQGLNQIQQEELMQSLETDGMEDIQSMILASITPKAQQNPTF